MKDSAQACRPDVSRIASNGKTHILEKQTSLAWIRSQSASFLISPVSSTYMYNKHSVCSAANNVVRDLLNGVITNCEYLETRCFFFSHAIFVESSCGATHRALCEKS